MVSPPSLRLIQHLLPAHSPPFYLPRRGEQKRNLNPPHNDVPVYRADLDLELARTDDRVLGVNSLEGYRSVHAARLYPRIAEVREGKSNAPVYIAYFRVSLKFLYLKLDRAVDTARLQEFCKTQMCPHPPVHVAYFPPPHSFQALSCRSPLKPSRRRRSLPLSHR